MEVMSLAFTVKPTRPQTFLKDREPLSETFEMAGAVAEANEFSTGVWTAGMLKEMLPPLMVTELCAG